MSAQIPFRRIDGGRGGRRYELSPPLTDRKYVLPSVTTILSNGVPKPALKAWGERLVAEAAVEQQDVWREMEPEDAVDWLKQAPNRNMRKAGKRGTDAHASAEMALLRPDMDVSNTIHAKFVRGFAEEWIAELVCVEQPIVCLDDDLGWAGTTDLVFYDHQHTCWLADWKTGKGVYPDYALQLAAYARGTHWVEAAGTEDVKLVEPVKIDRLALLHLTDDGITVHTPTVSIDKLYSDFCAVQKVARALKENKLTEIVRPPLPYIPTYVEHLRERCAHAQGEDDAFRTVLAGRRRQLGLPALLDPDITLLQLTALDDLITSIERDLDITFGPTPINPPGRR